ncbi:MAG: gliding motility-associated C-terminal domain-containing protein [Saprospiraceae bacterium]|nr:gliding motility-associated C-terminal domain-containing protein [Saprospiraceae bacterium]
MRLIIACFALLLLNLTGNAQPLMFIDKADSINAKAVDVAGDDFGAWFALVTGQDSTLSMIQFNYCGEVEQSHRIDLPLGVQVSEAQVVHLGQRKYLITAVAHSGIGGSRILIFYSNNANISSAQFLGASNSTEHHTPMISVYDNDRILLAYQFRNAKRNLSSRVVLLDSLLNPQWTKELSDSSDLKWILMTRENEFVVGDGLQVRKYDTSGSNIWSRGFTGLTLMQNTAIQRDSHIVFGTDYVDPIPDTGQIKRPRFKQVIAIHENGDFVWESDRIRNLRQPGVLNEYNNRLFLDGTRQIVFHGVDTVNSTQQASIIAHKINNTGRVFESVYFKAEDTVRDYKAGLINDGNVGICAVLGNDSTGRGMLNIKAATRLDVCDSAKFNFLQRGFINMQEIPNIAARDSQTQRQAVPFRALEVPATFVRQCEKFDLQDSEIPEVLCKGDSVFLAGIQIPNARYEWSNGTNQSGTWVKEAGRYSVKIEYCGKSAVITYIVSYRTFQDIVFNIAECNYPRRLFANQFPDSRYKWQTGDTTSAIDVSGPGTYNVTVTKCEVDFKITFIVSLPKFENDTLNFDICSYPDTIYANFDGNGARFLWDNDSTQSYRAITKPGTYNVTIFYCQSTFTKTFIIRLPEFNDEVEVYEICNYPDTLYPFNAPGATYNWDNGSTQFFRPITNPGTYKVTISYCQSTFTNTFIIKLKDDLAEVKLDSCNKFPLPIFIINKPKGVNEILWSTGQTTDTIYVLKPGIYSAILGSCIQNFNVQAVEEKILQFPNVFVPQSQIMENQSFKPFIKDITTVSKYELAVFNRWGQKVFETTKIDEGWDGIFDGNPAPVDTYTYYAKYERAECGVPSHVKGSVTLVK